MVDPEFDFWGPFRPQEEEILRVPLSSDPSLPIIEVELPKELVDRRERWNITECTHTEAQIRTLIEVLERNAASFAKDDYDLGRFTAWEHTIDTGDHPPVTAKPRKLSRQSRGSPYNIGRICAHRHHRGVPV